MYLMLKDEKVLYFNLEEFVIEVIRNDLLPFSIRSKFKDNSCMQHILYNIQSLKAYLSSRVLSLSRDNAKMIYTAFGIPQRDDIDTRVKICLACKGVSVNDSYWIMNDTVHEKFSNVNIRINKFKEIVDISLNGVSPTVTTVYFNPELTTHGLFRKAWTRLDDGLYLLKSDKHNQNINTKMEVLSSNILDCFYNKIDCVEYTGRYRTTTEGKIYVDKCKNFVGERYSFVEAWEVQEYANRLGNDFKRYLGVDYISASIPVIDYLVSNTDRHGQNYGFLMDNATGKIVGLAPLFDFNMALVSDYFNKDVSNTLSQMFNDGTSILDLASMYRHYSTIIFDKNKFDKLRKSKKEYDTIFENILRRCEIMKLV